jgi:hypothetical protein
MGRQGLNDLGYRYSFPPQLFENLLGRISLALKTLEHKHVTSILHIEPKER